MAEVTWEVSLLQSYVYALHNSRTSLAQTALEPCAVRHFKPRAGPGPKNLNTCTIL